jgi:hypothetical protein
MKKRKFRYADGGDTVAEGRFDEDTYARARKFIEDQERRAGQGMANEEAPAPRARAAAPAAPSVSPSYRMEGMGRGRPAAAQIPVDTSMRGPAKEFSPAMGMSDTGRVLSTTVGALGGAGTAAIRGAPAARTAIESAKGVAAPAMRAAKEGIEVAKTAGPKAGMETARSTLRGMKSRAEIQAKRGARQTAEEMEKAKPILKSRKDTKAERASRTRRSEEDSGIEFSRGGSASSRADGCAKRGKTRGKVY